MSLPDAVSPAKSALAFALPMPVCVLYATLPCVPKLLFSTLPRPVSTFAVPVAALLPRLKNG